MRCFNVFPLFEPGLVAGTDLKPATGPQPGF